jgi:hypothetical protein
MVTVRVRTPFRQPQPPWVATPLAGSLVGAGGSVFVDLRSPGLTHGAQISEANTGPRSGSLVATVTGDVTLETDGATYSGRRVEGNLLIRANNVTVTDCSVAHGVRIWDENTGARLEWCSFGYEADGARSASRKQGPGGADVGVGYGNYTAYRCKVSGFADCYRASATELIECTGKIWHEPGDHGDMVQSVGGLDVVIRRCNFDARAYNDADFSNAVLMSGDTPHGLTIVEDSLLAGGGFTLRMYDNTTMSYRVTGNRFVRDSSQFGTHAYNSTTGITWAGNTFSDNNQVVPL